MLRQSETHETSLNTLNEHCIVKVIKEEGFFVCLFWGFLGVFLGVEPT